MLKYLESNGYLPAGSTWTALSMGWEIASTGGQPETFADSGFRVSMVSAARRTAVIGWWVQTAGSSISERRGSTAPPAHSGSSAPWWGSRRPAATMATGSWRPTAGSSRSAMPASWGRYPGLGLHPAGSGLPHSLDQPIVGIVPSANGQGYYMVAADGGVFAFNSMFAGSCPSIGGCAGAAVAVAPDASGKGYWLATSSRPDLCVRERQVSRSTRYPELEDHLHGAHA